MPEKIDRLIDPEEVPEIYTDPASFIERIKIDKDQLTGFNTLSTTSLYISKECLKSVGIEAPSNYIIAGRLEDEAIPHFFSTDLVVIRTELEQRPASQYTELLRSAAESLDKFFERVSVTSTGESDPDSAKLITERSRREIELMFLRHEATHWQQDVQLKSVSAIIELTKVGINFGENIDIETPEGEKAVQMLAAQLNATLGYSEIESYLSQYIGYKNASDDALRFSGAVFAELGVTYLHNQSFFESEGEKKKWFLLQDPHTLAALVIITEDIDLLEKARNFEVDFEVINSKVAAALENFIRGENLVPENLLNDTSYYQVHQHLENNVQRMKKLTASV